MKKLIYILILPLFLWQCQENKSKEVKVSGKLPGLNNEMVTLRYFPKLRGTSHFEGFTSIAVKTDSLGKFELSSELLGNGYMYHLVFRNTGLLLTLFEGDDILVDWDPNRKVQPFLLSGDGSGRNNVVNLSQFSSGPVYSKKLDMKDFGVMMDSIVSERGKIIDELALLKVNQENIHTEKDRVIVNHILNNAPLLKSDVQYLKKKILLYKAGSKGGYIPYLNRIGKADSSIINFNDPYFDFLSEIEESNCDIFHSMEYHDFSEVKVIIDIHRSLQEEGTQYSYAEWYAPFEDSTLAANIVELTRSSLEPDGFDFYYGNELSSSLNIGWYEYYEKDKAKYETLCTNRKYLNRLNQIEELMETWLMNEDYDLGASEKTLSYQGFKDLLDEHNGDNLYVIVWSARYVEAGILPYLPLFKEFESQNADKINVIDICIDEERYKSLWAAKIIDYKWHGEHYFYPIESESTTTDPLLDEIAFKKIFAFCWGEYYFLKTKDGKLYKDIESPREQGEFLEKYIAKTVR